MDDIEAIKQLTHRYNLAFDYGDVSGYLDTWSEDGFFERSNAGRAYQGHAQLEELVREFPVDGRHLSTNFIVEVDGDTATASSYLLYLDKSAGFAVSMFGVYADKLVRTDTGWKFSERRLKVDVQDND
jgi:ketosteroid isomerase-like protein